MPRVAGAEGAIGILESIAGVELAERSPIELRCRPMAFGDSFDVGVVEQDGRSVAGHVDVALENMGALVEGGRERGERILGLCSGGPAMADDERTFSLEKRVWHGIRVSCAAMGVLTRDVILRELEEGRIRIDPFDPSQVGVASIDLTLGAEIREIVNDPSAIQLTEDADYRDHTRVLPLDQPYRLDPGVTIHGITAEHVTLPSDLCGFLEGRSRFARLGLMIHVTSALVQPGVSNRQVLEMSNVSSRALEIVAGVRICQLVLMRAEGQATYRGRFQDQREI